MAVLISCQTISKSYGTRRLFNDITLGIQEGERVGLIGPNGAGKSTLMKILAGIEEPDDGDVNTRRQMRAGYLPQADNFDLEKNAEQILIDALEELHLDIHEREHRAAVTLGKTGFSQERQTQPVGTLSGGWRKRVAIAKVLVLEPDLVLMDEPTNHLDLEGILWLEGFLKNASFGYMVVSHDRYFLENTTNRIIELSRSYPDGFYSVNGPYSEFLTKREEFLAGQRETQKALQSQVKREIEWLRRGPPARTTKSRARIDEAGRLIETLADVKARNNQGAAVKIDFNSSERQANKLVVMKGVAKAMGDRSLIEDLTLILSPGMKLGLLGPNGSGKTTFLKLLTGELEPDTGTVVRAEKLEVVKFDQNRELLDPEATLRRALSPSGDTVVFRGQATHVSAWAKRFLFQTEQLEMPVKNLSGGEQARILIARLMLRPADLLLLDEPTNDLDIPSLEVLEESLADFPGAIVLVTHDRFLLQRVSTDILGLDGEGSVGLYTDYTQWENAQREAKKAGAKKGEPSKSSAAKPAEKGKKLTYKEQKEWEGMEALILQKEAEVERVQKELEDPLVTADARKLQAACSAMADAQGAVDKLYARWAELEEKQK